MANSVEILPIGNTVTIMPAGNRAEIKPIKNSVECSLFDVTTAEYFLSAAQILEEHEEVIHPK